MIRFELWIAGTNKMEFYESYNTLEDAQKVAKKKKELGFVGTISIYKVTTEKMSY
jgi:hypothetical protein